MTTAQVSASWGSWASFYDFALKLINDQAALKSELIESQKKNERQRDAIKKLEEKDRRSDFYYEVAMREVRGLVTTNANIREQLDQTRAELNNAETGKSNNGNGEVIDCGEEELMRSSSI